MRRASTLGVAIALCLFWAAAMAAASAPDILPDPTGQVYYDPVSVSLARPADSVVYYTTDGSVPDDTKTRWVGTPFTVSQTTLVRAVAVFSEDDQDEADATYTFSTTVATPNISPNSQTFTGNTRSVSISCATGSANIHYTA